VASSRAANVWIVSQATDEERDGIEAKKHTAGAEGGNQGPPAEGRPKWRGEMIESAPRLPLPSVDGAAGSSSPRG